MKVALWSIALCAIGALAAPGIKQQKRQDVSTDGSCGNGGATCLGSFFGDCCSEAGFCGNTNIYCGQGCQSGYGNCTATIGALLISNDGTCGSGVTCQGSIYGDCCSAYGFCGSTDDYCSASSCDSSFGLCGSFVSSSTTSANGTALAATIINPTCPSSNGTIFVASSLNQYEIDCGFDRPGNDLKTVQVYSNKVMDCIAQCEAITGCVDIVMSGTACYMKKAVGKPSRQTGLRGARLFKRAPAPSSTSSTSSGTSSSVSVPVSSTVSSSSSSVASSASSSVSFIASASNASSSVLPSSSSSASSTTSAAVAISTNPTCPSSNATQFIATSGATYQIECYMDRAGNDLKMVQVYSNRIADCINQCDATAGCVDVSMAGTACYMKSKAGSTYTNTQSVRGARKIADAPVSSSSSSIVSSTSKSSPSSSSSSSSSSILVSAAPSASINSTASISSSSIPVSAFPSASANSTSLVAFSTSSLSSASGSPIVSVNSTSSVAFSTSSFSSASGSPIVSANSTRISSSLSTSTVILSTGVSSSSSIPLSTGASSFVSVSSTGSSPYGNRTTSTVVVSSTGTGVTSAPLSTGVSSSTIVVVNSTASGIISVNSTTSTVAVPLTTAPATFGTGVSSGFASSTSSGLFSNSTTLLNSTASAVSTSTTSYAFAGAGGIKSGHPLVTNTTACSVKPTSTATCVPCEGQPGSLDNFCGYTAYDNSYDVMPITCDTVTVNLDLTECTVSPDGIERKALCVNGQSPGPLIEANWGDTIVAHVTNSMSINGTSIHWHGMRQNYTNEMDGVVSVTQCALAPGESMTYTFKATNYGFSWYHSHLTLQAYEGLFGPMWVHGPQTQYADAHAGELIIQDWSHIPVEDMYIDAQINGVRTMDSGIINGMNVWGTDGTVNQTGQRYVVPTEFVPGQSYMFNLVNTAIQSTYKFYIDGHNFTVISADYVPIVPYETNILNINIGQRYQIIVTADQLIGDYWLRFDNQNACATTTKSDDIKGIIRYAGSAGITPNSTAYTYDRKYAGGAILGTCTDEDLSNLVPACPINVGAQSETIEHTVAVSNSNPLNLYRWYLDGTTFQTNWADATLYDIYNNGTIPDYSGNLAIDLPNLGEWVYIIIESPVPLGHPIHLHGHDFHILARGYGTYDSSIELNLVNPPRRDVAFMPGDGPTGQGGFLVIAFQTDNPGAWLMHCHIGWHVAMGFALQIIEAKDQIADTVSDSCMLNDVCASWRSWADDNNIHTDDSGV